jgi:GNAT superfamily N-acetyltransferase
VAALTPPLRVETLSARHDRAGFASGVEPLDHYLWHQAGQDIRHRLASCFVLTRDDERVPLGYYTLSATGLILTDLPARLAKRLPKYPMVPSTLMGRLAVDARHRRKRYGELLLLDAFSRALRSEIASYAFVVDAKDDTAARFYCRYGFAPLVPGSGRLFMPMTEIAKLFAE